MALFLPTFVKQIGLNMGAERVITALVHGNAHVIEAMPPEHVRAFTGAIVRFGKKPVFVDVLAALCAHDGKVRRRRTTRPRELCLIASRILRYLRAFHRSRNLSATCCSGTTTAITAPPMRSRSGCRPRVRLHG